MAVRSDHQTILELSRAGWSLAAVAERVGCDVRTVSRVRKQAGVSKQVGWQRVTPERLAAIESMLADGCSHAEIRRTLGVGHTTMQRYFAGTAWSHAQSIEHAVVMRKFLGVA